MDAILTLTFISFGLAVIFGIAFLIFLPIKILLSKNNHSDISTLPRTLPIHDLTKNITYESECLDTVYNITDKVSHMLWNKLDKNLTKDSKTKATKEDVLKILNELKTENPLFKQIDENEL